MKRSRNERGLVVLFALVLMGAVAMIATAFAVLVRTEKKAARNSCLAAQAELSALSGLERAVAVTERALTLATANYAISPEGVLDPDGIPHDSPYDADSGWHRYFEADIAAFNVASAQPYAFDALDLDKPVHSDSFAYFTDVGQLGGEPYIVAADVDGASAASQFISFDINDRTEVLVGFAGAPPSWINADWVETGLTLSASDSTSYSLYSHTFDPFHPNPPERENRVELGGNEGSGGRMYVAVVKCGISLSNPTKWVWHYLGHDYAPGLSSTVLGHVMRGGIFRGAEVRIGTPWYDDQEPPQLHELKYASDYAVCVVDLDGKMHVNSSQWGDGVSGDADKTIVMKTCFADLIARNVITGGEVISLLDPAQAPRSIREIASIPLPKPPSPTPQELKDWRRKTYAVEAYLTPYPVGSALAPVNLNSARPETVKAALCQVPNLKDDEPRLDLVVSYITSSRPYASRAEFESALFLATQGENGDGGFVALNWDGDNDEFLTEEEFNDILNSTSSSADDSDYDDSDSGNPGVYSLDAWESYTGPNAPNGPSQFGGDCSETSDATWGCEFKFTSRYFHIYSVGLVRDPETNRVLARRKLHAVYDAEADRLLWFRWNVTERGNIGDFSP